jgi:hypothetical protein
VRVTSAKDLTAMSSDAVAGLGARGTFRPPAGDVSLGQALDWKQAAAPFTLCLKRSDNRQPRSLEWRSVLHNTRTG